MNGMLRKISIARGTILRSIVHISLLLGEFFPEETRRRSQQTAQNIKDSALSHCFSSEKGSTLGRLFLTPSYPIRPATRRSTSYNASSSVPSSQPAMTTLRERPGALSASTSEVTIRSGNPADVPADEVPSAPNRCATAYAALALSPVSVGSKAGKKSPSII